MEINEIIQNYNINEDDFRAFIDQNITENLNHARHVETEIHTFTGIYMALPNPSIFSGGDLSYMTL